MRDAIFGILILCGIYRMVMGEWPDTTDPDFIYAIEKVIEGAS
jgi:hypothetical protein